MAQETTSPTRVVEDARRILRTVRAEIERGRRPYASDVRRLSERSLALRFPEYVQFLEKYGFLTIDRRTDTLVLTAAGEQVVDGHDARMRGMAGDAKYHFGDRLNAAPLADDPGVEAVRVDGRYLKYELIGRGGLGTVWRGHHLALDRPVAVKLFEGLSEVFRPDQQEEARRRMELAVRSHARLVSPFVVQVLDQNADHEPPYFVMELAEGGNLRGLLESGPLSAAVAVRYFVQVALGLKAAHAQGLLHRDLKPEAVLLDGAGNVKLSDFGLTRIAERDGARVRQAYVGFGSVGYMAPELFRGSAAGGPAVDIYALGILLYEMLTGELPGRRSPMPSQMVAGVPTDLDELFDQMTQDDPASRPADIDQVLTALWTSKDVVALLDARQAPFFVEPPMALPGLPGGRRAAASAQQALEAGDPHERSLEPGSRVAGPPSGESPAARMSVPVVVEPPPDAEPAVPAMRAPESTPAPPSAPQVASPAPQAPTPQAAPTSQPAPTPQAAPTSAPQVSVFQAVPAPQVVVPAVVQATPVPQSAPAPRASIAIEPPPPRSRSEVTEELNLSDLDPSRGSGPHPVAAPTPRGAGVRAAPIARRPIASTRPTGDHPALEADSVPARAVPVEDPGPEVVIVTRTPLSREEPSTDRPVPQAVPVAVDDDEPGLFASQSMGRFTDASSTDGSVEELELDDLVEEDGRGRGMSREEIANRLKKLRKS